MPQSCCSDVKTSGLVTALDLADQHTQRLMLQLMSHGIVAYKSPKPQGQQALHPFETVWNPS